MIRSFKCKKTEKIFNRSYTKKFPTDMQRVALRKLRMLNRAENLNDLKVPPGNRLEALKGKRKGQHSIRINDQWRICFLWQDRDALDVEITDYH
ncbi:plasmid maintenance system killer [candidate division WOR-1 bacterium DG_54_3]|uniref:Plasmid maintenance system killer n=1 Tax=candidate division WOR-1 bacterium DG_54_3 TaxID=1703775 RepID=A0A0S7Y5R8_UNCSA|nr:MAG: plasmid maintenance system killer [candidate division WOR-1 bacterium DG_54_3]